MARHRRASAWSGRLRGLARTRTGVVAGVLAFVALSGAAGQLGNGATYSAALAGLPTATAEGEGGRGYFAPVPAAEAELAAAEAARVAEEEARAAWLRDNPPPVAGLDQAQMNNALRIVQSGQAMGLPKRAYVIAVATAMQESRLYNLASTRVAESYHYWHEGSGSDHDSVGLFQQRASGTWGEVHELMNPHYAAAAFYRALVRVPGWESMALTRAAQRVQVSAYPNAYAKHEARAQEVVDALVPAAP